MGDAVGVPPALDALIADLECLDGAEAFVHPERMADGDEAKTDRTRRARAHRSACRGPARGAATRPTAFSPRSRAGGTTSTTTNGVRGITGDVVLLHVATMTNLFAAIGWTLCLVLLDPDVRERGSRREADRGFLDRCALEAVRIGQRSIMLRQVLKPCEVDDGTTTYHVEPGVLLATMLPLTNTTALPGLDRFDPERWAGRRLREGDALDAKEAVTTFGHGSHRCPAQRFSLSAIGRVVERLLATFDLRPQFDGRARGAVADRWRRPVGRPLPGRLRPQARRYCAAHHRRGSVMADEIEFDTPWRRDLGRVGNRARRVGRRQGRRRRDRQRCRVAG